MDAYLSATIAGILAFIIGLLLDRLIKGSAYKTRDEIVKSAEAEAKNVRQQEELAGKEALLKRREELEAELNTKKDAVRDAERGLDKRASQLGELKEDFKKKEKMLQNVQTKLADRAKVVEAKQKELDRVLKLSLIHI